MSSLGGSIFIRNAIDLDYCIKEAALSLIPICDEVVIGDAQSTDGTLDILRQLEREHSNVKVIEGLDWECANNYEKLSMLANQVKGNLKTDWHFMLQADEIIHEESYDTIKLAIERSNMESFMCKRYNLYGSVDRYIGFDVAQDVKPCSDEIIRLAKTRHNAYSDAESLQVPSCNTEYTEAIKIFHYGMVRDRKKILDKVISMQSWFWGPNGIPDKRITDMKENNEEFRPWECKNIEDTTELTIKHPKVAHNLVERLRR